MACGVAAKSMLLRLEISYSRLEVLARAHPHTSHFEVEYCLGSELKLWLLSLVMWTSISWVSKLSCLILGTAQRLPITKSLRLPCFCSRGFTVLGSQRVSLPPSPIVLDSQDMFAVARDYVCFSNLFGKLTTTTRSRCSLDLLRADVFVF